jgi:type 1 glutamine amidotransferase
MLRRRGGPRAGSGSKPAILLLLAVSLQAAPIKTLILSGQNNHDWRTTTPYLRQILSNSNRFEVKVDEEPAGLTDKILATYDLLILDYNGPRWSPTAESAVQNFVRNGKGLVVVHGASYAFGDMEILGDHHVKTGVHEPPWPAYAAMTGASWSDAEPKSGHAPRHFFRVNVGDKDWGPDFTAYDELYHNLRMQAGVRVVATAFDDPKNGGTGKNEPVLWTVPYGKGRVFHTTLGHDVAAMQESGFINTLLKGAEWAATTKIEPPDPDCACHSVRVLAVTGGHDHETTFYSIFDGDSRITVNVNPHPIAYAKDLRKGYDVLVLYDSIQTLDDAQKANLKAFVEDGAKGLVVLHHAIVDFQDWPWWTHEVVGGSYLKSSTYLHDQELEIVPTAKHPILTGVGPMHLWDETYKSMWISPDNQVLLKTNHPTSDGPIAWISPYKKAKVVYIQLGHGHQAHQHPAYRQLVRNAILWSAGKEP